MTGRPLFTATLAFIGGIVLGRYTDVPLSVSLIVAIAAAAIWLGALILDRAKWRLVAALICALAVGVLRITPVAHPKLPPNHIAHWADQSRVRLEGAVVSARPPAPRGDVLLTLEVTKVVHSVDEWTPATGRVQVLIRRDAPAVSRGDTVALSTDVRFVTTYRTPGAFDRAWRLGADGVFVTGYIREGERIDVLRRASPTVTSLIDRVRNRIRRAALDGPPERASAVLALVLGDESRLDRTLLDAFQATGIIHILSISGLHIAGVAGLVFLLVWMLLARLGALPLRARVDRWAALIALPFPIAYAILAGGIVSVVRACVMYLALIVGILLGRRRDLYVALALAALVILFYQPANLWSKGFQFSFVAVLGMIYFRPMIAAFAARTTLAQQLLSPRWMTRRRRNFLTTAGFSVAAFAATAPVSLWHFGFVAPMSIVANLAAIPIFNLFVIPPLLLGAALLPLSETLAQACWALGTAAMDQVYGMALLLQHFGPRLILLGRPAWWELLAMIALLLVVPFWRRRVARIVIAACVAILVATPLVLWRQNRTRDHLTVTMIDVRQGLSMLVETPGGKRLLFDGGGEAFSDFDVGRAAVVPFLSAKRIGHLDVVVASHPHPDHYKGLFAVLDTVPVDELWTIKPQYYLQETGPYFYLSERARERGIRVRILDSALPPLRLGDATISVLNPPSLPPRDWSTNDQSLVLSFVHDDQRLLLTSDAGQPAERLMLSAGARVQAGVAQVGHHGSFTASSPDFVRSVAARYALISAGRYNQWHHPSPETLDRWAATGARIMRTDQDGTLECDWRSRAWRCRSVVPASFRPDVLLRHYLHQ